MNSGFPEVIVKVFQEIQIIVRWVFLFRADLPLIKMSKLVQNWEAKMVMKSKQIRQHFLPKLIVSKNRLLWKNNQYQVNPRGGLSNAILPLV